MSNLKAVAKLARVSVTTVCNVMRGSPPVSDDLKSRVQNALLSLDYHPNHIARSLKTKQSKTLGIVIPDITISFYPKIVQGAEHAARVHGYTLITLNTDEDLERETQALTILRSQKVDGILLVISHGSGSLVHIENAARAHVPLICLDRVPSGLSVSSVCADNVAGARECILHLLDVGHREIAAFTGPEKLNNEKERLLGYKLALKARGVALRPDLIWRGTFPFESALSLCEAKLADARQRPSAVFTTNGIMAIAFLETIYRLGLRCPQDIALATFDELTAVNVFEPRITTVVQPAYEIGWHGAKLLIDRLNESNPSSKPIQLRLKTALQVRESSMLPGKSDELQPQHHRAVEFAGSLNQVQTKVKQTGR